MALEIVRNDDFIEYFLFPTIDQAPEIEEDATLDELLKQINEISNLYTSNYIWHKDPFNLKARNRNSYLLNPDGKGESCLHYAKESVHECLMFQINFPLICTESRTSATTSRTSGSSFLCSFIYRSRLRA